MTDGLDDFKRLLKEFRGLSVWAVGSGLVVPFAASMADLSPPWPSGVVAVTAVIELIALVLVFQFFKTASRRVTNRVLIVSLIIFAITGSAYLAAASYYTYQVPTTKERFVKGYECTSDARLVFEERCPDLGLDELKTAEYEADRLWTRKSIAVTRIALVLVWLLAFMALSFALGGFLSYQMRAGKSRRTDPARVR